MMDLNDYTVIYKDANRQILVNKTDYNYSLVAKDGHAPRFWCRPKKLINQ